MLDRYQTSVSHQNSPGLLFCDCLVWFLFQLSKTTGLEKGIPDSSRFCFHTFKKQNSSDPECSFCQCSHPQSSCCLITFCCFSSGMHTLKTDYAQKAAWTHCNNVRLVWTLMENSWEASNGTRRRGRSPSLSCCRCGSSSASTLSTRPDWLMLSAVESTEMESLCERWKAVVFSRWKANWKAEMCKLSEKGKQWNEMSNT